MNKLFMMGLLLWYVSACNGAVRVIREEGKGEVPDYFVSPIAGGLSKSRTRHARTPTGVGAQGPFRHTLNKSLSDINTAKTERPAEVLQLIALCFNSNHKSFNATLRAMFELPCNKASLTALQREDGTTITYSEENDRYSVELPTRKSKIKSADLCLCYMLLTPDSWISRLEVLPEARALRNSPRTEGGQWAQPVVSARGGKSKVKKYASVGVSSEAMTVATGVGSSVASPTLSPTIPDDISVPGSAATPSRSSDPSVGGPIASHSLAIARGDGTVGDTLVPPAKLSNCGCVIL